MNRHSVRLAFAAILALGTAGCGSRFEHDPGPGPSTTITTSVDPSATVERTTVTCAGPADQLAMLGTLCGVDEFGSSWNAHVGDQSLSLRGVDGSPALLLFGFYTQELPEGEYDHTTDIRYAAYVVLDPPPPIEGDGWASERQLMRSWTDGEALSGSVLTVRAASTACGFDFIGTGTLVWRETTITIAWSAVLPC